MFVIPPLGPNGLEHDDEWGWMTLLFCSTCALVVVPGLTWLFFRLIGVEPAGSDASGYTFLFVWMLGNLACFGGPVQWVRLWEHGRARREPGRSAKVLHVVGRVIASLATILTVVALLALAAAVAYDSVAARVALALIFAPILVLVGIITINYWRRRAGADPFGQASRRL